MSSSKRGSSSSNLGDLKNWELYQFTAAFQDAAFLLQVNNLDGKDYFVEHFTSRVIKNCISQDHKKKCGNKFDIHSFLQRMASDCFDATIKNAGGRTTAAPNEEDKLKLITIGGRTQSGKTAIKALGIIMAKQMGYPSVVMTKGLKECSETLQKFDCLLGDEHEVISYTSTFDKIPKQRKMKLIRNVLSEGGTLLIIDNGSQVGIAHDMLDELIEDSIIKSFVFMVDEADSAYRTEDRKQYFETEYDRLLRETRPIMTFMVSATPLPYLLDVAIQNKGRKNRSRDAENDGYLPWDENFAFFDIPTSRKEYVGLDMMKILKDPIKKTKVYLEDGDIRRSEIYHHPKYDMLYEDAIKAASTKTGILLLDTSVPWVEAKSNVYEKAELILQEYPSVCIITYTGTGGICVKGPFRDGDSGNRDQRAARRGRQRGRKVGDGWTTIPEEQDTTIGSVIDSIPLHIPVFILGYHKAIRCISFRGDNRVPTHVGIHLGKGHSLSNLVQAIGRASGNNKSVLRANGHDHVTILVNKADFTAAVKHENFVSEFGKLMSVNNKTTKGKGGNMKAKDALVHVLTSYDDDVDFLQHTKREIGKLKGQRQMMKRIQSY